MKLCSLVLLGFETLSLWFCSSASQRVKQGSSFKCKHWSFCACLILRELLEENKAKNLYLRKGMSSRSTAHFSMLCQAEIISSLHRISWAIDHQVYISKAWETHTNAAHFYITGGQMSGKCVEE